MGWRLGETVLFAAGLPVWQPFCGPLGLFVSVRAVDVSTTTATAGAVRVALVDC